MSRRHAECQVQKDLDGPQDNGAVRSHQPVLQHIQDVIHFLVSSSRAIQGHQVQHLALRPVAEFLQSSGRSGRQEAVGSVLQGLQYGDHLRV